MATALFSSPLLREIRFYDPTISGHEGDPIISFKDTHREVFLLGEGLIDLAYEVIDHTLENSPATIYRVSRAVEGAAIKVTFFRGVQPDMVFIKSTPMTDWHYVPDEVTEGREELSAMSRHHLDMLIKDFTDASLVY